MEGIVQKLLGRPIKADCWVWAKRATQHRPRAVRKRGEAGLAGSLGLEKGYGWRQTALLGSPTRPRALAPWIAPRADEREHVADIAAEKTSRGSEPNVAL